MSEILGCPYSGAQQAREFLRTDHIPYPEIPEVLPPARSPEAYALDAAIKPATTAHFNRLIGQITTRAIEELPETGRHPLTRSPWRKLKLDLGGHYNRVVQDIVGEDVNSETVAALSSLTAIRRRLHPVGMITPAKTLENGAATAVEVSLNLIRDVQDKHSGPLSGDQLARTITKPIFELAHMNECQLEVFERSVIPKKRMPQITTDNDMVSYDQRLLDTAMTPNDRKALLLISDSQRYAEKVADVTSKTERIGCPIVYSPKDLVRTIHHVIASARERELVAN